jgi:hypothetical protein
MKIIGISGKAGAGKDTVAEILVEHGYLAVAFADEMKRICAELFGFSREQLWGPSHLRNAVDRRWNLSPRSALQSLGAWGCEQNASLWVLRVLGVVAALEGDPRLGYSRFDGLGFVDVDARFKRPSRDGGIVIPDVRRFTELTWLGDVGAVMARVRRDGVGLRGLAGEHSSETEQDSVPDRFFAHVLVNNGTFDDLRRDVVAAFGLERAGGARR